VGKEQLEVGLLACDHVAPGLRDVAGDYSDMFRLLFAEHAPEVRFTEYDVTAGQMPADAGEMPAWLVTGSRWSVYDDKPWIKELLAFIPASVDGGVPLVGVCFGHQAVAEALGGRTVRAEQGWGVGVHEAEILATRDWMDPPTDRIRMLMSHQDQVVEVPPGTEVLARSAHCPVWMMTVADTALGVQGHPEFSAAYASALLEARTDRIPVEVAAAARETFADLTDAGVVTRWVARFLASRA
jgi:GMP synthase-like glutamine amidotransferase